MYNFASKTTGTYVYYKGEQFYAYILGFQGSKTVSSSLEMSQCQ
jgi:hypothetical protein